MPRNYENDIENTKVKEQKKYTEVQQGKLRQNKNNNNTGKTVYVSFACFKLLNVGPLITTQNSNLSRLSATSG